MKAETGVDLENIVYYKDEVRDRDRVGTMPRHISGQETRHLLYCCN